LPDSGGTFPVPRRHFLLFYYLISLLPLRYSDITITLDLPRFTRTTASTQQLPILDGLAPNSHAKSARHTSQHPELAQSSPPTSSLSPFRLSSESSDEEGAYIHTKRHMNMSTTASVEPTSGKAPVLTAGDISPAVMMDFENAALDFFVAKSVPAEKQVTMIIPGIKDLRIRNWITAERECIIALSFANFVSELHTNYLQQDWEDQVRNDILTSTLSTSKTSFWNWSQHLLKLNCLLWGTPSVFDEAALCNHLEAHLDGELKGRLRNSETQKDKNFKTWVAAVHLMDEARTVENKHQCKMIEETLERQVKHQNTKTDTLRSPSRRANTNQSASSSSSSTLVRLPALNDAEHTLLNEHDGCTKCCRFYTDHHSQQCPNGFPVGKGYKTLTLNDALAAKKSKATAKPSSKPVAATTSKVETVDSDDDISATAVVLLHSPAKYGSDSDEDWEMSDRDVSPPIRTKHLIWNCQVNSLTDDFPVKTRALIDNGAHLILIHLELVEKLALKKYCLNKPEVVDVAFGNEKNETKLYFYIKLSVTSLDSTWTSRSVRAIVTPGLCMLIILGLPWLEHNNIVTDHAACTCIDKKKNYDLLNPPVILPPPPPKPKLREQIKSTKADKKLVLAKLMMVCNDCISHLNLKPEEVKEFNVAGAIRDCIEILASWEALKEKEDVMKSDFKYIFEPIPHVNELPQDVVAEIRIKDAEKMIKSRSYPSPQKYKEAWQTLIQQHLDSGHIRPSSSPCTSPAFIVPKSNPNVLPHWVNDFHQLNENTVTDSHPLPRIDDILNDCAKGKIWGTINMTNSFFQTRMHPDHVHLTAVNTPLGLYEWLVMPMGLKNAPAIHQR